VLPLLQNAGATWNTTEAEALKTLGAWDHTFGVYSTGAPIYQVLCDTIQRNSVEDEMGEKLYDNYCTLADHWNFFKYFITDDASPFWDDIATPAKETRQDIVLKSFKQTVKRLKSSLGSDVKQWHWGRLHTMEFKHPFGYLPLLGHIFNVGPFPSSGGPQLVNNMLPMGGGKNYDVIAGPSTRRLIDFADIEHSYTILPTGNSGNFMSPHYGDQAPLFMTGQYRMVNFTDKQTQAHKEHELILLPG
jgi:penicillin amidase